MAACRWKPPRRDRRVDRGGAAAQPRQLIAEAAGRTFSERGYHAADADLADLLAAIARVTVAHRATGGVYRWEARYLDRTDRRVLRSKFAHVVERVTDAVRRAAPPPDEHLRGLQLRAHRAHQRRQRRARARTVRAMTTGEVWSPQRPL